MQVTTDSEGPDLWGKQDLSVVELTALSVSQTANVLVVQRQESQTSTSVSATLKLHAVGAMRVE